MDDISAWRLFISKFRIITKTRLFKYTEIFTTKRKWKFSYKKFWYFSYFCSKHRLRVLVRTATIYVLSWNKKNNIYPCKPLFYCIKVGFKGVKIIYVFVMLNIKMVTFFLIFSLSRIFFLPGIYMFFLFEKVMHLVNGKVRVMLLFYDTRCLMKT